MKERFVDYYKVLGITRDATPEEIQKAFHTIVVEMHSNGTDEKSNSSYALVEEAYSILSDSIRKFSYDETYDYYYSKTSRSDKAKNEHIRKNNTGYDEENGAEIEEKSHSKGVIGKLKEEWKEVREDEQKMPFRKRHAKINSFMYKNYSDATIGSVPKEICFRIGQGACHIAGETLYQLLKLRYIFDDSIPKYVIRNRVAIITLTTAIATTNLYGNYKQKTEFDNNTNNTQTTVSTDSDEYAVVDSEPIVLNRKHVVEGYDTFYQLAYDANIEDYRELERLNKYGERDLLLYGDTIEIPYTIEIEDLQYYTQIVSTENESIYTLAKEYETDIETLIKLNPEAFTQVDGTYIILSDTIIAPKFITRGELASIKDSQQYTKENQ